jgi:tRNA-dihydrouridine synthase
MKMEIKTILLRNGTYLISQITEMELEPSCFLADPMEIIDGEFRKFPRYTNQRNVLLYSESLATLATPDPEILSKYKEVLPPDDEILQ